MSSPRPHATDFEHADSEHADPEHADPEHADSERAVPESASADRSSPGPPAPIPAGSRAAAYPTGHSPHASNDENTALLVAAAAALLGLVLGHLTLRTTLPIFGRGSIGEMAAYAGAVTGFFGFLIAGIMMAPRRQTWMREISVVRRIVDVLALSALHAAFAFMLCIALFAVFSDAFRGLALDRWTGAFWVAAAAAVCCYVCVESALALTSESLSVVLAAFLVTGALASALSSPDPNWWHHHFSALGSGKDGLTFTITLLLAGLALATIGDVLGHDVATLCRATGQAHWRATNVRIALIVIGVLVIVVALIPVDAHKALHDAAAQSIVLVFAAALVVFPIVLRSLPGSFRTVTIGVIVALVGLVVLWKGVGYLNITAFEMGAAATVVVWLVLFVRTVSAAVRSLPASAP